MRTSPDVPGYGANRCGAPTRAADDRRAQNPAPVQMWVESPLQMLSAVECHHSGILGHRADLVPRDGLPSVTRTAMDLSLLDLPAGLRLVAPSSDLPSPRRGRTLVVGDPFSGQVQRRLVSSRTPDSLALVDDGLATVHLLDVLTRARPTPLVRARARLGPVRVALALLAAVRLRALARSGRLVVFTSIAVGDELARRARTFGVSVVTHDFPWLRAQPTRGTPRQPTVVLGTSLVANGLVHAEPYLAWVLALARQGEVAYYPHHREDARTLEPLDADPAVDVRPAGGPAELRLRGLGANQRVLSLPSTAVTSLRLLLARSGACVDGVRVPDEWWTPQASSQLREHLNLSLQGQAVSAAGWSTARPSREPHGLRTGASDLGPLAHAQG